MKTTRIAPGYYKANYKGYNLYFTKVEGYTNWFFQIDSEDAHDWQSSKADAILAAMEWIDYLITKKTA